MCLFGYRKIFKHLLYLEKKKETEKLFSFPLETGKFRRKHESHILSRAFLVLQ